MISCQTIRRALHRPVLCKCIVSIKCGYEVTVGLSISLPDPWMHTGARPACDVSSQPNTSACMHYMTFRCQSGLLATLHDGCIVHVLHCGQQFDGVLQVECVIQQPVNV